MLTAGLHSAPLTIIGMQYGSSASDPYITGGWTQHTWGDAIGDYMKTSQSAYDNTDGSTNFYELDFISYSA